MLNISDVMKLDVERLSDLIDTFPQIHNKLKNNTKIVEWTITRLSFNKWPGRRMEMLNREQGLR